MSAKRYKGLFQVNIPVSAWRDGEGVIKLHSEKPVCLSLLYWFLGSVPRPRTVTSL
jgi:hypothetical protein